jgi:hypothetical protein
MRVPRTKGQGSTVDKSREMQAQELKSLVESGHYKPDPARVAAAMLQRRGVKELLTGPFSAAGRTPPPPASPRQAA